MTVAILDRLFSLADPSYKAFHASLIPHIAPECIIGVRMPLLRCLASELWGTEEALAFLTALPHTYYEENNLHALLIEKEKNFDALIAELDRFLPFVDNWATCDTMSPKVFKKNLAPLEGSICRWLSDHHTYTVRFAIKTLMQYYLDEAFHPKYPEWVAGVTSDEYYIRMMVAWYFATALAKRYEESLVYLTERRLPVWTHNKAIQKAVESRRISDEQKTFLRTLKIAERN